MSGPVDIAKTAWGDDLPDWVLVLAQVCANSSQNQVARHLDRSASLISAVLRRKYTGDMTAVEERVRGFYMNTVVQCPALGDMPTDQCQLWRKRYRDFSGHNSLRVMMRKACKTCPNNHSVTNDA